MDSKITLKTKMKYVIAPVYWIAIVFTIMTLFYFIPIWESNMEGKFFGILLIIAIFLYPLTYSSNICEIRATSDEIIFKTMGKTNGILIGPKSIEISVSKKRSFQFHKKRLIVSRGEEIEYAFVLIGKIDEEYLTTWFQYHDTVLIVS